MTSKYHSLDEAMRKKIIALKQQRTRLRGPIRKVVQRYQDDRKFFKQQSQEDLYLEAIDRAGLIEDIGALQRFLRRNS